MAAIVIFMILSFIVWLADLAERALGLDRHPAPAPAPTTSPAQLAALVADNIRRVKDVE